MLSQTILLKESSMQTIYRNTINFLIDNFSIVIICKTRTDLAKVTKKISSKTGKRNEAAKQPLELDPLRLLTL